MNIDAAKRRGRYLSRTKVLRRDVSRWYVAASAPAVQRPPAPQWSDCLMVGGLSVGVTPVPIPNTAVKPHSADGTAGEARWESTTPPAFADRSPRTRSQVRGLRRLHLPAQPRTHTPVTRSCASVWVLIAPRFAETRTPRASTAPSARQVMYEICGVVTLSHRPHRGVCLARRSRVFLASVLLSAIACAGSERQGPRNQIWTGGPNAHSVYRIRLVQTDSAHVTVPISLALDRETGGFLISDGREARAFRFSRDGQLGASYGGPDFPTVANTWTIAASQGRVYVVDLTNSRLHTFDAESQELLRSIPLRGSVGVAVAQPDPFLWIGTHFRGVSPDHPHGAELWRPHDGTVVAFGLPIEFFRYPAISVHSA